MQNSSNITRGRLIGTVAIFIVVYLISLLVIRSDQPVTVKETLRLAFPSLIGGLFFLLFPYIAKLSQEITTLLIQRVANEITSQISTFATTHRRRKGTKKLAKYVNPMILDTSAIIDGRIEYVLVTGFIFGTFLIPNFILTELQSVADSTSALKRQRGRRGLEVLESLKTIAKEHKNFSLVVVPDNPKSIKEIDEKLVKIAKRYRGAIVTCDYNLNKVATVSSVKVLNVNDLVNALKTVMIPGESLYIKVVQRGKEKDQGVGYLEDGTMVVVEDGQVYVGSEVKIVVSRVLQTSAGRMIFGNVESPTFEMPKPKGTSKTTN